MKITYKGKNKYEYDTNYSYNITVKTSSDAEEKIMDWIWEDPERALNILYKAMDDN